MIFLFTCLLDVLVSSLWQVNTRTHLNCKRLMKEIKDKWSKTVAISFSTELIGICIWPAQCLVVATLWTSLFLSLKDKFGSNSPTPDERWELIGWGKKIVQAGTSTKNRIYPICRGVHNGLRFHSLPGVFCEIQMLFHHARILIFFVDMVVRHGMTCAAGILWLSLSTRKEPRFQSQFTRYPTLLTALRPWGKYSPNLLRGMYRFQCGYQL